MKTINEFDNVQEITDEIKSLPAGGYICRITSVEDVEEKEYLKIEYDIADGEYKGWWSETYQRAHFWGGSFIRSYKERAAGFFKAFVSAVEKSNDGYKWDWDEKKLIGKIVGIVIGEEEYYSKKHKKVKTRYYADKVINLADLVSNKYKIPELKKVPASEIPASHAVYFNDDNENVPF